MLKVGDKVQDMHPVEFEDNEPVTTGLVWFVTAVDRRDDGKFTVVLEHYGDQQMTTSTMVCEGT